MWFNEQESGSSLTYDSLKAMYCWKNADHLVLDLPMPFRQEELWVDGRDVVPCRARVGGVTILGFS